MDELDRAIEDEAIRRLKVNLDNMVEKGDEAEEEIREADNLLYKLGWIDEPMKDLFLRRWAEKVIEDSETPEDLIRLSANLVVNSQKELVNNYNKANSSSPSDNAKQKAEREAYSYIAARQFKTVVESAIKSADDIDLDTSDLKV
jgi:hypothetical protein